MDVTRQQALAFLRALWPTGENYYISSHARTYIEARIGDVPQDIPWRNDDSKMASLRELAQLLRGIAHHLDVAGENVK